VYHINYLPEMNSYAAYSVVMTRSENMTHVFKFGHNIIYTTKQCANG